MLGAYRELTGRTIPLHAPTSEILQQLWNGRPDVPGRPVGISLTAPDAVLDFRLHNADASARTRIKQSSMDEETESRWIGPLVSNLPCLTEAKSTLAQVREKHGPWVEQAFLGVVVQAATGERFPLQVVTYWSPDTGQWNIRVLAAATLEYVAWPY